MQLVEKGPVLPPDLDHIGKACRRQQCGARSPAFQQRVRRHCRAVDNVKLAGFGQPHLLQTGYNGLALICRRCRRLVDAQLPVYKCHEIRKCTAYVNTHQKRHDLSFFRA